MKKRFYVFIGFFIGMLVLMGPIPSIAQMAQPDERQGQPGRDLNQQQPQRPPSELEPEEERGLSPEGSEMIPTKGKVSGEVLNVDPPTGLIEIRTDEGLVNIFTVEGEAKRDLAQIKKGDHVDLMVVLNAVEVTPQSTPGGPTEEQPAG